MNYIKYIIINTIALTTSLAGISSHSITGKVEEKPLVAIVCSYNNIKWAEKNLDSIFSQRYRNYRVIYVDDGSTDGTGDFVERYINEYALEDKVIFIRNKQRLRKLANVYRAIHLCKDNEIVVMIDGDDWLAHRGVFKLINKEYENKDVWFTYGQYRNEPVREAERWGFSAKGYSRPVSRRMQEKKIYRPRRFVYMHLRTFYAWLFKLIKLEDFIATNVKGFKGDFYPASNDLAMYYPIAEMAHKRTRFIAKVLYVRNLYSDIVGFKVDSKLQNSSAVEIRKRRPYAQRVKPVKSRLHKFKQAQADLFLFCNKNGKSIADAVRNIDEQISGVDSIYVFYANCIDNNRVIKGLQYSFPAMKFISYNPRKSKELKEQVLQQLNNGMCDHILLLTDTANITKPVNVQKLIHWLEKTFAHGFYLDRSEQDRVVPRHVQLGDNVCAWKFNLGAGKWRTMYNINGVLYRKINLKKKLETCEFNTISNLRQQLKLIETDDKKVGLFYKKARVIF